MEVKNFIIEIEVSAVSYKEDPYFEVARILREHAKRIEKYGLKEVNLYDINQQKVGRTKVDLWKA